MPAYGILDTLISKDTPKSAFNVLIVFSVPVGLGMKYAEIK